MNNKLLQKYAATSTFINNHPLNFEKIAISPFGALSLMGAATGAYGAGKSGVSAYKNFSKGDSKQGWKDLGWAGVNLAGSAVSAGWGLNWMKTSAKLTRIAAKLKAAGKPAKAAVILQKARGMRAAGTAAKAKELISLATKASVAGKADEAYKLMLQAGKLQKGKEAFNTLEKAVAIAEQSGKMGMGAKKTLGMKFIGSKPVKAFFKCSAPSAKFCITCIA